VSRTLSDLQRRGYIDIIGKDVLIKEGLKEQLHEKLNP
jgi:hypothetical protein